MAEDRREIARLKGMLRDVQSDYDEYVVLSTEVEHGLASELTAAREEVEKEKKLVLLIEGDLLYNNRRGTEFELELIEQLSAVKAELGLEKAAAQKKEEEHRAVLTSALEAGNVARHKLEIVLEEKAASAQRIEGLQKTLCVKDTKMKDLQARVCDLEVDLAAKPAASPATTALAAAAVTASASSPAPSAAAASSAEVTPSAAATAGCGGSAAEVTPSAASTAGCGGSAAVSTPVFAEGEVTASSAATAGCGGSAAEVTPSAAATVGCGGRRGARVASRTTARSVGAGGGARNACNAEAAAAKASRATAASARSSPAAPSTAAAARGAARAAARGAARVTAASASRAAATAKASRTAAASARLSPAAPSTAAAARAAARATAAAASLAAAHAAAASAHAAAAAAQAAKIIQRVALKLAAKGYWLVAVKIVEDIHTQIEGNETETDYAAMRRDAQMVEELPRLKTDLEEELAEAEAEAQGRVGRPRRQRCCDITPALAIIAEED